MNWFTSDTHFGHGRVIEYSGRPFSSTEEMDRVLIAKWNARVKKEDTVYFLGDFCFKKCTEAPDARPFDYYRSQLNGTIHWIAGNHDHGNGFNPILQGGLIKFGGKQIYLVHKPEHMNFLYDLGFCGHVHQNWKFKMVGQTILVNVGVDQWNFESIS